VLAAALGASLKQLGREGAVLGASAGAGEALRRHAAQAERLLQRRHALLGQTQALCGELTGALTDLAEDESWARGQCQAMQAKLGEGLSGRGLRSVSALLHSTRTRQRALRAEREQAREALKSLIHQMLQQVGELGSHTGRFTDSVARYADVIEHADSLESLAGAVREMVAESRTVQDLVGAAQQRLQDEHARASDLSQRVKSLEDELRHLSEEVSTDPLTQIANRRGLMRVFDSERARVERSGSPLALGLIDVDDFKRLNDRLGHSAGDEALKSLVLRVQQSLRPSDVVARYGGEEFVVVLPETPLDEARQVLSRTQRATTEALFLHENAPVFVTFSAGVTMYRPGERLEDALDRADEALYEAKRTGKNRTCAA
jgi:diguanylate cyclase